MIINHNLAGSNAIRNMNVNSTNASKSMQKLSSGLRINSAADDAAGLAISEKMRGQIRGLDQASSNAQDAISLIQTGEGALSETTSILQRMRELAVQSASDTNIGTDRKQIQGEVDQLATEITRISNTTEFNQKNLLGGNLNDTYQVGANKDQNINLKVNAMDAQSLGVAANKTVTTGTAVGNVGTATYANTVGAKVVDGATLTFQYNAASAAKSAVKTADSALGGSIAFDTATKITIGGTDVALTNVKALGAAYDGATNIDTVVTKLQADIDATSLNGAYTVGKSGTKLTITSTATGAAAAVNLTGSDVGTGATLLGITTLGAVNGADATSANVTVSDGSASQAVDITDPNATSFTVTTGNFNGVSITTASGTKLSDLSSANDKSVVSQTVTASTKATFAADGTMTEAKVAAGIDVSSQTAANSAIKTINDAIETVSTERSKLGAYSNRLDHTIANLGTSSENLTSAESRIRDVDMAKEMATFSKNNILAQAAQAMLAQANQQPQQVLQLLR